MSEHTRFGAVVSRGRVGFALVLGVLLLGAAAARCPAQIILDTFGPNDAFDSSSGGMFISGGSDNYLAAQFVPGTNTGIVSITAALRATGGNNQSSLIITIYADAAGLPGTTPLWTSQAVIVPLTAGIYTFTSTDTPTLTSGQAYWLVFSGTITSGNAAQGFPGVPPVLGTKAQRIGMGSWMVQTSTSLPAVRITGSTAGACCNRVNGGCAIVDQPACTALGLRYDGFGSACTPGSCHACPADFNGVGGVTVQDLFDFLKAYFAHCP